MKTSLRLMLTALLVCGITYAAAGAPLPAQTLTAQTPAAQTPAGQTPAAQTRPAPAQPAVELAALSFSPQ